MRQSGSRCLADGAKTEGFTDLVYRVNRAELLVNLL
jgi:hypothetical protein